MIAEARLPFGTNTDFDDAHNHPSSALGDQAMAWTGQVLARLARAPTQQA